MFRITLLATAAALAASVAGATPILGLAGDRTLVRFDSDTAEVGGMVEVTGVDRLLGIDLRPSTGQIIGVTDGHGIVEIGPDTGAATEITQMDKMLPLMDGQPFVADVNPMADKLRFMTGETNHRVDVDSGVTVDGSPAFEEADMHAGEAPMIVAAAYINSFDKQETTAMYDIDATIVALIKQTSPNDGTLAAVGKLAVDPAEAYAFDIATDADGANSAWLVAGTTLHRVSLETGAVVSSAEIAGLETSLRDLTVLTASKQRRRRMPGGRPRASVADGLSCSAERTRSHDRRSASP